jgi:adenylate cyclase
MPCGGRLLERERSRKEGAVRAFDGANIAARLESICEPGAICLSEDAYRQVKGRLELAVNDLGPTQLKNIAEPVRVYSLEVGKPAQSKPVAEVKPPRSFPSRWPACGSGPDRLSLSRRRPSA